jgi:membrane fusion protein (multidrug efflux system)
LLILLAALAGCGADSQPAQLPPLSVRVMVVERQQVPVTREFVGRLTATRSADVRARVAGVLQRRLYQEGTEVKAGQPLFQIDPQPLQAELNRALAALARAEAEATNAKMVADRARKLIAQGLISQAALDDAQAAERSTAAQVKQAKADVDSARIRLSYARVTAPISGRAAEQQVTEGALVGEGEATLLTVVEQIDPLYVNFDPPANVLQELTRMRADPSKVAASRARVQIVLSDGTEYEHLGTIDFSGTRVDPNTGTIAFRGIVPNPEHRLLPGMFVKVRLMLGERGDVFLLPQAAVLRDTQSAYVWAVGEDNKAVQKRITTDATYGGNWIVTAGLNDGDRIAIEGLTMIQPGTVLQPVMGAVAPVANAAAK